jgi:hypothetical protein
MWEIFPFPSQKQGGIRKEECNLEQTSPWMWDCRQNLTEFCAFLKTNSICNNLFANNSISKA